MKVREKTLFEERPGLEAIVRLAFPTVIGLIGQGTAALSDNGYGQCRFIRLKSRFPGTD